MFLHMSVILFTGGVYHTPLGRHPTRQTPPEQTPPWADTPCPVHAGIPTPPPSACWDMVNKHPSGMHSCFGLILQTELKENSIIEPIQLSLIPK